MVEKVERKELLIEEEMERWLWWCCSSWRRENKFSFRPRDGATNSFLKILESILKALGGFAIFINEILYYTIPMFATFINFI